MSNWMEKKKKKKKKKFFVGGYIPKEYLCVQLLKQQAAAVC